jgi:hypothetical protein
MRQVFLAMSTVLPHPIYTYRRDRLSRLLTSRVEGELAPMLARSERIDASLLTERAWSTVQSLLELSSEEKEFVDRVNGGELEPALIAAGDDVFASLVRRHPAILWKVENARHDRG